MPFSLPIILQEIRSAFLDYRHPHSGRQPLTLTRIAMLLFKLDDFTSSPENILQSMLPNEVVKARIKFQMIARLRSEQSQDSFIADYEQLRLRNHSSFRISHQPVPKMMKDIFETSKSLLGEFNQLSLDLETFENQRSQLAFEVQNWEEFQIGYLLKMVNNQGSLDIDIESDCLLFRLHVLWQQFEVILKKAQYVLDELSGKEETKVEIDGKFNSSSTTKRSALSQSVQLFKLNEQRRQAERKRMVERKKRCFNDSVNLISSDYKLVCSGKEEVIPDKRRNCCFRLRK